MGVHRITDAERALLRELVAADAADDALTFHALLAELPRSREQTIHEDVARISRTLQSALSRFRMDSRIAILTEQDIPDARQRLDHVVELTEAAANRTLDLIERSVPLADATARGAAALARGGAPFDPAALARFLDDARGSCETVRGHLTDVMLAQGFQDITGQIIRSVRNLIGEVEGVLESLMELHGIPRELARRRLDTHPAKAEGPAVPGVTCGAVEDQAAVDDLMAGLGI